LSQGTWSADFKNHVETKMRTLEDKVAIVTGATQGIGAAYARGLVASGAAVSICDVLDPSPLVKEITDAGGKAFGKIVDITKSDQVRDFVALTNEALGAPQILVNNAGLFTSLTLKSLLDIESDEWDRVMAVNVRGTFEVSKAVIPFMKAAKYGKIINIASATVNSGQPFFLHYVASKGALIAMTRSMARELGTDGIRVNVISPGFTISEGIKTNPMYTEALTSRIASMRAIVRDQTPDDLVGTVIYFASPASDFVTGQTLIVDGGTSMS
jgi:NAD(P)-dependent dehydrogenase (short-subunit alcohol dehydrogenase family)